MADALKSKLTEMDLAVYEDDAGMKIGGDAGNLICNVLGDTDIPSILLMAHMDTVTPGLGKNPVIEGDIIKSDGKTILGGDDVAGIVIILETVRILKEENIKHGDIQIVFSVAEESGLWGAKNLDYSKINAKFGFVLDSGGQIGTVAVTAPTQNRISAVVRGKAAHAGIEPEKGVSAIQIASKAISNMKLGRIDNETTANIGIIQGGLATNIISDLVEIKAEARSRDTQKLQEQTEHMKECFEEAAKELGGSIEFASELMYPAFNINESETIINILKKASKKVGIDLVLEATGGGSDTNIINDKGIQAVDLSVGMENPHSVEEQINIEDMLKTVQFLVAIAENV